MRMVVINNLPWAVGLHWSKFHARRPSRQEIWEKARNEGSDCAIYRVNQYGLGSSKGDPSWQKCRALAWALLRLPATFQGVFALEDTAGERFWWVFSRRDGIIVGGMGDLIYPTQAEAESAAQSLRDLDDGYADRIVCATPEESMAWLMPFCEVNVLSRLRGRGLLEPLEARRGLPRMAKAAGVLALLAAGLVSVNAYMEHKDAEAAREAARRRQHAKEEHARALMAEPMRHFNREWLDAPAATDVAASCAAALRQAPTVANGWELTSAVCGALGKKLTVSWAHRYGASYLALPEKARLKTPQEAVSGISLDAPAMRRRDERLMDQEAVTRVLYHVCQVTGTKLRLAFNGPEKKQVEGIEVVAPWSKGDFELEDVPSLLMLGDMPLASMLATVPGLILDDIALKNNVWTFKGRVYASHP